MDMVDHMGQEDLVVTEQDQKTILQVVVIVANQDVQERAVVVVRLDDRKYYTNICKLVLLV